MLARPHLRLPDPTTVCEDMPGGPAPWTTEFQLPRRLGQYQLREVVGRGGLGVVYRALDLAEGREVAVKLVQRGLERRGRQRPQRLQREAQALSAISHPAVVSLLDHGTLEDDAFLVLEYVDGPTLKTWQREGAKTKAAIVDAYLSVGEGLAALHAVGLVHRDFKPANVMIDPDGRPRLLDLGLATWDASADDEAACPWIAEGTEDDPIDLTRTGMTMGTPCYMAPEQVRCESLDARADQFSFCLALYEALHGERPFEGTNGREVMESIAYDCRRPLPLSSFVPTAIARVIERGLSNRREQRFPTMAALLDALRQASTSSRRWMRAS